MTWQALGPFSSALYQFFDAEFLRWIDSIIPTSKYLARLTTEAHRAYYEDCIKPATAYYSKTNF
jgi:hypothetical protein